MIFFNAIDLSIAKKPIIFNMDKKYAKKVFEDALNHIAEIFKKKPYFFLNEHDVLAYLYTELIKRFNEGVDMDQETTSAHCKVGSYSGGKHEFQPDLSILNTKSFFHNCVKEGKKKSFYFDERLIAIEFKYCITEAKKGVFKKVKEDYSKLVAKGEFDSYVVMFDHNSHLNAKELIELQNSYNDKDNNIKIVYISLNKNIICIMNSKECNLYGLIS